MSFRIGRAPRGKIGLHIRMEIFGRLGHVVEKIVVTEEEKKDAQKYFEKLQSVKGGEL